MSKIVLDARQPLLAEELSERCRLTGVPLVVAVNKNQNVTQKILGAAWAAQRNPHSQGFAFAKQELPLNPKQAAKAIAKLLAPNDVLITPDSSVAEKAQAKQVHTIVHTQSGALSKAALQAIVSHVTTHIPAFATLTRTRPIADRRLIVDADNMPLTSALIVARTHEMPLIAVHNDHGKRPNQLLLSDPRTKPKRGGFWVNDICVPTAKNSADNQIVVMAGKRDLIFTNDVKLTLRCLRKGATVIDNLGATYRPKDYTGGTGCAKAFNALRAKRRATQTALPAKLKPFAVIDAAEKALA